MATDKFYFNEAIQYWPDTDATVSYSVVALAVRGIGTHIIMGPAAGNDLDQEEAATGSPILTPEQARRLGEALIKAADEARGLLAEDEEHGKTRSSTKAVATSLSTSVVAPTETRPGPPGPPRKPRSFA